MKIVLLMICVSLCVHRHWDECFSRSEQCRAIVGSVKWFAYNRWRSTCRITKRIIPNYKSRVQQQSQAPKEVRANACIFFSDSSSVTCRDYYQHGCLGNYISCSIGLWSYRYITLHSNTKVHPKSTETLVTDMYRHDFEANKSALGRNWRFDIFTSCTRDADNHLHGHLT